MWFGPPGGPPLTLSLPPTRKSSLWSEFSRSSGPTNQRALALGSAQAANTRAGAAA
jgi:hypothetical protein